MSFRSRLKAKNLVYIDQIVFVLISFQRLLQCQTHSAQTQTHSARAQTGTTTPQQSEGMSACNELLLCIVTFSYMCYCLLVEHVELLRLNEFLHKAKIDNINMFKVGINTSLSFDEYIIVLTVSNLFSRLRNLFYMYVM